MRLFFHTEPTHNRHTAEHGEQAVERIPNRTSEAQRTERGTPMPQCSARVQRNAQQTAFVRRQRAVLLQRAGAEVSPAHAPSKRYGIGVPRSWRSTSLSTLSLLCIALLLATSLSFAESKAPAPPPDPAAHTVLVPFDETQPLASQKPQRYYLNRAEFERLWATAKENRKPAILDDKDDAHPEAVIQSALYRATLEDERVVIEASYTLQTRGRWAKTSLALQQTHDKTEAALREITVDGKPGALSAGVLAVESPGTHAVHAIYDIPRPKQWTSVGFTLPRARAALLSLTLGSTDGMPFLNDNKLISMLDDTGAVRVVTCVLGSASELKIERTPRRPQMTTPPPSASVQTTLAIGPDLRTRAESRLRFSFPGAARRELTFSVEPGWDVVGVNATKVEAAPPPLSGAGGAPASPNPIHPTSPAPAVTRIGIAKQGELSVFTVGFAHDVVDEATLIIGLSPMATTLPKATPAVLPGAAKYETIASLAAAEGVEIAAQPQPDQSRIADMAVDWAALGMKTPGSALHYRLASRAGILPVASGAGVSPASLAFTAKQASSRTEARVDYVFQLSEQKAEVSAALVLTRQRGEWSQTRVGVPAGMEIQSVMGPQVVAWQQVGSEVFLHFAGSTRSAGALNPQGQDAPGTRDGRDAHPTSSEVRFVIYLASAVTQAQRSWTLQPFTLPDVEKVKGSAIIAAHKALEAKLVGFKTEHDLREVEPGPMTAVFTIASPLEKQRAIEFERAAWSATVALEPLAVRFSADAVLLAQATDAGILLSQQLAVNVEQGALRRVLVRLPKALPEASVTGEQLREMRASIVGEWREYECSFQAQGGLLGASALTFTMQLPISDAELSLPFVQVEGAERLRRFFVVDNASSREAKTLEAKGVELTPKESLPYVPEQLAQPKFYLASGSFSVARSPLPAGTPANQTTTDNGKPITKNAALRLAFTQLQATEGNAAVVTLADITTVLRTDGERWDTVVYSLYNRSLQFLPVVLPDKAELIAVSVGGEPVRADEDRTARDGSARRVRLIPLIQTRPGQRSMEVRLVYRLRTDTTLPTSVRLDDPELVGLSAERTVWTASLPKGYTIDDTLRSTYGNMEPIAEESREVELLQGLMSDLARINRVLSLTRSAGNSYGDEEMKALSEAETLNKQIEAQTKSVQAKQNSRSRIYNEVADETQAKTQTEAFNFKLGKDVLDLNNGLQQQQIVLTENRIAQPVFSTRKTSTLTKVGDGKLLLANGNTWAAQAGAVRVAGSTVNNTAPADALGLNDNIGVNNGFFTNSPLTINGSISGSGGTLIKSGAGTLTLSAANTYTGGTTMNAGTLTVTSGGVIGTGALAANAGNTVQFGGVVSNTSGSQSQVTLNSTNTYTGATNLNSNNFNSNARGNVNFNNGGQLNTLSNTTGSVSQTAPMDLNGGVVTGGFANSESTLAARGLRFNSTAIKPDSIDGLISADATVSLAGRSDVSKVIDKDAKDARQSLAMGDAPATPMPQGLETSPMKKVVSTSMTSSISLPEAPPDILNKPASAAQPMPAPASAMPPQAGAASSSRPALDSFDKSAEIKETTRYLTTQAVNQLRPTGRRSLAISVPSNGPTYHFRKLKDHAVLALDIERQPDLGKRTQAWVFWLGLALVLGGAAVRERLARRV